MRISKTLIIITTVAVVGMILAAACRGSAPEAVEIPVIVSGETMDPGTLRVKQGDMVTLKIETEEAGEFHLHGYDFEQDIDEGEVVDLYFVADATGRFRITFHHSGGGNDEKEEKGRDHGHDGEEEGEEIDIGFLEVGPR